METEFEKLKQIIRRYCPTADLRKIRKAYEYVELAHRGQKRLSGEPVLIHLLKTAEVLAWWRLDTVSIIAGLLHDVVEDTDKTEEEVQREFGEDVAVIVNGVTKIGEIKLKGREEEVRVENLRKMILVMAKDLRVVLVKLADRYHNMQTLSFLPVEKQQRIAKETLEVYAPLAERLGIGEMKGELEDLAFPYVYPQDYQWVKSYSAPYYHLAEENMQKAKTELTVLLKKEKLTGEVHGRTKHLYSLWQKLLRPEIDKDITKIYDLVALRILMKTVRDCYAALGAVHKLWKPIPVVGIRDFIAQPKPNGYRSIHTTVFGLDRQITEVQFRTFEMHDQAENGIAAHWHYSQLKNKGGRDEDLESGVFTVNEKLLWVRQLVSWQKEIVDSHEYLNALKFDALNHRIFVFSPQGDAFDLPVSATPVDFAYLVHSDLGDKMVGAKVNGKMVALNYQLKSGELVEVVVDKHKKVPSRDWLNFVVTHAAKKKISGYFK